MCHCGSSYAVVDYVETFPMIPICPKYPEVASGGFQSSSSRRVTCGIVFFHDSPGQLCGPYGAPRLNTKPKANELWDDPQEPPEPSAPSTNIIHECAAP